MKKIAVRKPQPWESSPRPISDVSEGIHPIFTEEYRRKVLLGPGTLQWIVDGVPAAEYKVLSLEITIHEGEKE